MKLSHKFILSLSFLFGFSTVFGSTTPGTPIRGEIVNGSCGVGSNIYTCEQGIAAPENTFFKFSFSCNSFTAQCFSYATSSQFITCINPAATGFAATYSGRTFSSLCTTAAPNGFGDTGIASGVAVEAYIP